MYGGKFGSVRGLLKLWKMAWKNSSIESFLSPEITSNKPIPDMKTSKCMHRLHDLRDMRKFSASIGIRTVFLI